MSLRADITVAQCAPYGALDFGLSIPAPTAAREDGWSSTAVLRPDSIYLETHFAINHHLTLTAALDLAPSPQISPTPSISKLIDVMHWLK